MSINDKEYKRECLQGIPTFTLTTSECGRCCFVMDSLEGQVERITGSGVGECVHLVVNASVTLSSNYSRQRTLIIFLT